MNGELKNRIYAAVISANFVPQFFNDYVYFRGYSPSGENISFEVYYEDEGTFEDIFNGVLVNFTDFDADEHAVMWWNMHGEKGAPKDLKKLLKDARCIKIMYQNLYLHMRGLKKEWEEE